MISLKLETLSALIWGCRTAFETWRMCASMLSPIGLFANPWTVTCQSPSSVEFSKQEHWSGCHFLLQGIFLSQGLNVNLLHWKADSLPLHHLGSPWNISSVQFNHSVMSDSLQPHGLQHTRPPCPSPTNTWSLLKPTSIESVMPSNHLIPSRPLLLPPSIFSSIRVFSNESVLLIRWPKYWSFSFNISPFREYSGLISFRMDWLDLLAVQGTLCLIIISNDCKVFSELSTNVDFEFEFFVICLNSWRFYLITGYKYTVIYKHIQVKLYTRINLLTDCPNWKSPNIFLLKTCKSKSSHVHWLAWGRVEWMYKTH